MGEVIWATFFFQEVFPHADDDDDDDKGRMGPPTYVARCGAENNQKCFLCFMYFCVFFKSEKKQERALYNIRLKTKDLRVLNTRLILGIFCPTRTRLGPNTTRTEYWVV